MDLFNLDFSYIKDISDVFTNNLEMNWITDGYNKIVDSISDGVKIIGDAINLLSSIAAVIAIFIFIIPPVLGIASPFLSKILISMLKGGIKKKKNGPSN